MSARNRSPVAYERTMAPVERWGLARQRGLALAPASGRVLEVEAGTGLNLAHYPHGVAVVVAEPDPARRARLSARVAASRVAAVVVGARLPGLPFGDGSFDTVVSIGALSRAADVAAAIGDLRRVLAPAGELLFLEPSIGRNRAVAALQRALAPSRSHDIIGALRAGGFVVGDCERLAPAGRLTAGMVVRGRAIKRISA